MLENNGKFADHNLENLCSRLGLDHSCPWLRKGLPSKNRFLASDFLLVLGLSLEGLCSRLHLCLKLHLLGYTLSLEILEVENLGKLVTSYGNLLVAVGKSVVQLSNFSIEQRKQLLETPKVKAITSLTIIIENFPAKVDH